MEDRADALLATGRAAEIIGELEAAVADAPLRERRWGQLMLALYRAGRQGEALGAYQRARALLADELGVDPGPNLRRLEALIVAQDAALEVPATQRVSSVTRAVTFLLTDIEGSTAAWEADADAMAVALARHDELVEQVVTSRGGRLIKTRGEGDATFSVFDRPSAAAAAAIELQDAIVHEPWALSEPMRVRVALHTGEAELRDGDYFGRAVNRAARLRSLATGGQILCSGATAELVIDSLPDHVALADLGRRELRNLARPEHVFELRLETAGDLPQSVSPDVPMERPALPAVLAGPGPFVGRGDELQRLFAVWQTALAGGTNAVLIAGEPGVGKTRLAGEWSRQAYDQGALVIYGRCDEDLGAPYQPFAEALRALVPCLGTKGLRGLRGVEALLALVPGLTDILPDLAAPTRADPDTERYALFDAVVAVLTVASASAPVVLILDDLHWAAKPTLLLLRHLLRFGEQARLQIIGTYRSTDLDRSHPLAAMLADLHRDGSGNRIQLSGLDEDDVTAYVAEAGYHDEELARALASVTGGNPFFLIEALRHVDESGGRWDQSTLPQGVREAVSRRLTRLLPETNKALAAAAVVGSRFALELVERVVGDDLVDAFDEACKAGIVIEEPGGRYRFNHALVRQSLLAELPSVRRMRLHQRIAATLESQPGADDELLAELAHHYFECAWAGNAAKAVEYCRRAADQAMARLAYEGAADLYDHALHALEEIDDELPDRDDQAAELLVARCEALLAAGDVASAAGAVSQLQGTTVDSARLAAWATCFDGQLSMLIHPERLDEAEAELSASAAKLAELDDAAGEAKAHTVRAGCLARLGRIGDCEVALDDALTAARRAREHRRVNNVLANAPLAALWGPNPVPRAGGRCLDVVRLLRITTDSPAVEATSTRCQAVLEAFRGRAAAARRMIDSARRTVTELGLRHALLEVEQFAGIVELVVDEPAAAEPHLLKAYNGFRRMGLDADTAETAALLGRTCLALDRGAEADALCVESERLAGHALKPSIAWRTLRAQLLARAGDHGEARRVAEAAVGLAERTDLLVDHGDACATLAMVLGAASDAAGARAAAERAVDLYERKGAAALAEKARGILGKRVAPSAATPPEAPAAELDNACVRAGERVIAAIDRQSWDEIEQLYSPNAFIESRRKVVGFPPMPSRDWVPAQRPIFEAGAMRMNQVVIAVRGERLALSRLWVGGADESPGAPYDEFLNLYGIDEEGRFALQLWFDLDDIDAALAELDAVHARFEDEHPRARRLENAATRADDQAFALFGDSRWEELSALYAEDMRHEDRRQGLRRSSTGRAAQMSNVRAIAASGDVKITITPLALRGDRLYLCHMRFELRDPQPDAFKVDILQITEVDDGGVMVAQTLFDIDDFDTAIAELDARYAAGEAAPYARTWTVIADALVAHNRREIAPATQDVVTIDHRRVAAFAPGEGIDYIRAGWDLDQQLDIYIETVHRVSELGAVFSWAGNGASHEGFAAEWHGVDLMMVDGELLSRVEVFDEADIDAAIARFERLSRPAPRLENAASRTFERMQACFTARDWDALADMLVDDFHNEDRRRVVNAGLQRGRDAAVETMRRAAELGITRATSTVVATRGEHLVLAHARFSQGEENPETFQADALQLSEIGADGRLTAIVMFDAEDFDAAFEELEARYLAGEATAYVRTWSLIADTFAALNYQELPATAPDWVHIDHRPLAMSEISDLADYLRATWDLTPQSSTYVERVHRLTDLGAILTTASRGTSQQGFDVEWRELCLIAFEGNKINRAEVFDEADLDAAIARFDQLSQPASKLENAAARVFEHVWSHYAARDWHAMAESVADDFSGVDHRRVVSAETQHGLDDVVRDLQAAAEVGFSISMVSAVAIRGERLVLARVRASGQDPGAIENDALNVVEIDDDERIANVVTFDLDDFDAAIAELDARYVAGEAAEYSRAWSVISGAYAAMNRHEFFATTPDFVDIDHRHVTTIAAGDTIANLHASWELAPDLSIHIEAVHKLNHVGAVITYAAHGTSTEGFQGEWRAINILTVEGDLTSRAELFDEADIDTALARFDQLSQPAPQLQNAASQVTERLLTCFIARDWDAFAGTLAANISTDDRRRVVNAGIRQDRNAELKDFRSAADLGVTDATSDVIATRGDRLVLTSLRLSRSEEEDEGFHVDLLWLIEIDADKKIAAWVTFDLDDSEAAITELDARYLIGEAAAHARTWSVITRAYAALNRGEHPATTPDWVNVDHRQGISFATGAVSALLANWNTTADLSNSVEAVHRLTDLGAVVTSVSQESSSEGFEAESRAINVLTIQGGLIDRLEVFDEADLDAALVRFDQLSRPAPRLENAASRVDQRFNEYFVARDWAAMAQILADDVYVHDRRRVVNAGVVRGRDALITNMRGLADVGAANSTAIVIATRGSRLILVRQHMSGRGPDQFDIEMLAVVEINTDSRLAAVVAFDPGDFDAALGELDARYLAGQAAPYAHTWPVVAGTFASISRRELPSLSPDCASVDHRSAAAFAPGELPAYIRAGWEIDQEIRPYIEAVHRLDGLGAVVSYAAHGTSREGFEAEWREIALITVEGDMVSRCELFDWADLDAAIARFDQLSQPTPRPENAATRMVEQFLALFADRDWDAMAELLAEDFSSEDRRPVVNTGTRRGRDLEMDNWRATRDVWMTDVRSTVVATRGERLALCRFTFASQELLPEELKAAALSIVEINDDNRGAATVVFDPDDFDAAFAELDARYLAGEAAAQAETWSVIAEGCAALNRHELPEATPDLVSIDHRRVTAYAPGELIPYVRAGWDLEQNIRTYVEVVHRLSDYGAVYTHAAHGVSVQGFDAEWRGVDLVTVERGMVNRCEVFDEADLDAALVRFEDLRPRSRLANAASRTFERFLSHFTAREWDAMAATPTENFAIDDRRRVVNAGIRHGRANAIHDWRAAADVGFSFVMVGVIATRGERIALLRVRALGPDPEAIQNDAFNIIEIDADERVAAAVVFDLDDIEAAFAELDARYLAGEAAAHARTWSVVTGAYAAMNRHELFPTTSDWVNRDHRRPGIIEDGGLNASLRSLWELIPDLTFRIEAVHRLTDLGVACSHVAHGVSRDGFDAEWRGIEVITTDGQLINRCEIFDAAAVEAALAHFEALRPQAPSLENTASRVGERYLAHFAAADWDAMTEMLADNFSNDDRRRVVGIGVRHGRGAQIGDMRTIADLFSTKVTHTTLATRGANLAVMRLRFSVHDQGSDAFLLEAVGVLEINADERIVAVVFFDVDGLDAAYDELEARYLAGEAAPYARVWKSGMDTVAELNRHEPGPNMRQLTYVDRRRVPFASGEDFGRGVEELWELVPDAHYRVTSAHALDSRGTVVTFAIEGTDKHGSELQWRRILLFASEGPRLEVYEEENLDAALARFKELRPESRRLENTATRVDERFWHCYTARDWDAMAALLADDVSTDDRRRVVNGGVLHGRDVHLESMRSLADLKANMTSTVIATRGQRLALTHLNRDLRLGEFGSELLYIIEIDADHRLAAGVFLDADDIDAAFEELDARYLEGEAAAYSQTWTAMTQVQTVYNRHEFPPTTKDAVNIDHRRGRAFSPEDVIPFLRTSYDVIPNLKGHIEAVHRLSDFGAVITEVMTGTSREGFEAEWREIGLFAFDGELVCRFELFDETDLDAALARFEELRPQARRLENAASRTFEHFLARYVDRDWDAVAEMLADDIFNDDRRRVVSAGVLRGRDATVASMRASAALGVSTITSNVIATRGERLALSRDRFSGRDGRTETFFGEVLGIVEIDADGRIVARIALDLNDIDAAFEELDARYLAGEAASNAPTWSVVAKAPAQFNRHELFATTPDPAYIDHRRLVSVEGADLAESIRAVWDITSDASVYIEAVHRLNERGAVFTEVLKMTSRDGFDAEVRMIMVFTVEGGLINRVEVFDDQDLDIALARFDELRPEARRLENSATRLAERFFSHVESHKWDAMAEIVAEDSFFADRRHVVNLGVWHGRDLAIANLRVLHEIDANVTLTVIATRGERLALTRVDSLNRDLRHGEFDVELLSIVEAGADNRIATLITFDPNDIDIAFAELEARYLTGEAAAHAHTWSVLMRAFAALNQHEVPAITPDWVRVDHRSLAPFEAGDWAAFLHATWDVTPNLTTYIEVVHRLSDLGAVVTHASHGTSQDGMDAEWRIVDIFTVDGELISGAELFDEADLDAALARFDELDRPPQLENAATRIWLRLADAFDRRDLDGFFVLTTADLRYEDRRKGLQDEFEGPARRKNMQAMFETVPSGSRMTVEPIAIRGQRLALTRTLYSDPDDADGPTVEILQITEVSRDGLLHECVSFDPDDIDGAFAELTARWVGSGEGPHPNDYRERQPGNPFGPFGPKR